MTASRLLLCGLLVALAACDVSPRTAENLDQDRTLLPASFLLGQGELKSPLNTSAYQPAAKANPSNRFEGTLELQIIPGQGQVNGHMDRFGLLACSWEWA